MAAMFVERVALDPVPAHAQVGSAALREVLARLAGKPHTLSRALDAGFREMEARQPCLAKVIADELAELPGLRVQAVAYFLAVLVYRAFEEAFGVRMAAVQGRDLNHMLDRLIADGELRSSGAGGTSYSEDAIAIGQPALVGLLRQEIDRAVEETPNAPWEALDTFYESLLVMVLVLTQSVAPSSQRD
ncbi:MAG TPA: hypothetical protein VHZ95_01650 [Polyangiales bacterium]|nr:hypothetical protein [Polyangiales bacterium]